MDPTPSLQTVNASDEDACTEIIGSTHEEQDLDEDQFFKAWEDCADTDGHSSDDIAMQDFLRQAVRGVNGNSNILYLDLMHNSLKKITIRHLILNETELASLQDDDVCIVEVLRKEQEPGALKRLLDVHLEKVELRESLSQLPMMLVSNAATELFRNIRDDGLTFSKLPYGLGGLKRILHKPADALAAANGIKRSRFSTTTIDDHSTEALQAKGIRKLHFHTNASKYDWVCLVKLDNPIYAATFQSESIALNFDETMAITIEIFEIAQYRLLRRMHRSELQNVGEAVARSKFENEVDKKHILYANFAPYLAKMTKRNAKNVQPLMFITENHDGREVFRLSAGAVADEIEWEDVKAQGNITNAESKELDKVESPETAEPIEAISVDTRDQRQEEDSNILDAMSANARKKRKAKERRHVRRIAESLKSQSTQQLEVEHNVIADSFPSLDQVSNVNTETTSNFTAPSLLSETHPPTTNSGNTSDQKYSTARGSSSMEPVRKKKANIKVPDDSKTSGEIGPVPKQVSDQNVEDDDNTGWQTVTAAHRKKSQSQGKNSFILHPNQTLQAKTSATASNTGSQSSTLYLKEQDFPKLPATMPIRQSHLIEAKPNRMSARKKGKKRAEPQAEPGLRRQVTLGDMVQQSPGESSRQVPLATTLRTSSLREKSTVESQQLSTTEPSAGYSVTEDDAAHVTDDDATPNASMLNLATAYSAHINHNPPPPAESGAEVRDLVKFDTYTWKCRKQDCKKVTSPWDGQTVICPRCGPYGAIRYCSTEHLLEDTTDHWAHECFMYTIHRPCDSTTIHPHQVQGPPAIPNLCGWDNPERHRQNIYHAAAVEGDYFIFTDAQDFIAAGSPDEATWNPRRGRGSVLLVVTFDDNLPSPHEALKDRFNRFLNAALFTGASNPLLLSYMFLMIRENLIYNGQWDDVILNSLSYQFLKEFGWQMPAYLTDSSRHACTHMWYGTPLDMCRDVICKRELLHPVTGHPQWARMSLKTKLDELERRYWILRVARVYHPTVKKMESRMRGVGTDHVWPGYKRVFCRGREWDGFPAGMMEIEGAIWKKVAVGPPVLESVDVQMGSITV